MAARKIAKAVAYDLGDKVRSRDSGEDGFVQSIEINAAGNWYRVESQRGFSIGIWHETDIDGTAKTAAPTSKRG